MHFYRTERLSRPMTYCLGIVTKFGLVMASDSRTNAGYDQVNTVKKMHTFVLPGERVFVLLASGSLSCTQSVMTLLRRDFDKGEGLAKAASMYDAARLVGEKVRAVRDVDKEALEKDKFDFNVHILLGGQIKDEIPHLYLIYPQGNPLQSTEESPFLQIGETKYGRPIMDRGIRYDKTTLEEAAKYALLSMDSTMKSNVTVGPPVDLLAYPVDELNITRHRRFAPDDPDLAKIRNRWEAALRQAVARLPDLRFSGKPGGREEDSIQIIDRTPAEGVGDQAQAGGRLS
jgi:putative proteasome-type protease